MTLIQSIHIVSKEELQYPTFASKCENISLKLVNGGIGKLDALSERKVLQEVKKVCVQLIEMSVYPVT